MTLELQWEQFMVLKRSLSETGEYTIGGSNSAPLGPRKANTEEELRGLLMRVIINKYYKTYMMSSGANKRQPPMPQYDVLWRDFKLNESRYFIGHDRIGMDPSSLCAKIEGKSRWISMNQNELFRDPETGQNYTATGRLYLCEICGLLHVCLDGICNEYIMEKTEAICPISGTSFGHITVSGVNRSDGNDSNIGESVCQMDDDVFDDASQGYDYDCMDDVYPSPAITTTTTTVPIVPQSIYNSATVGDSNGLSDNQFQYKRNADGQLLGIKRKFSSLQYICLNRYGSLNTTVNSDSELGYSGSYSGSYGSASKRARITDISTSLDGGGANSNYSSSESESSSSRETSRLSLISNSGHFKKMPSVKVLAENLINSILFSPQIKVMIEARLIEEERKSYMVIDQYVRKCARKKKLPDWIKIYGLYSIFQNDTYQHYVLLHITGIEKNITIHQYFTEAVIKIWAILQEILSEIQNHDALGVKSAKKLSFKKVGLSILYKLRDGISENIWYNVHTQKIAPSGLRSKLSHRTNVSTDDDIQYMDYKLKRVVFIPRHSFLHTLPADNEVKKLDLPVNKRLMENMRLIAKFYVHLVSSDRTLENLESYCLSNRMRVSDITSFQTS